MSPGAPGAILRWAKRGRRYPMDPTSALPTPLTGFVGRARELGEVLGLLEGSRLVTLTGPGGVGKTRLAIEAAARATGAAGERACFVDLAPLREPAQVLPAVARAL